MTLHTWLVYFLAVFILTASPGPSSLLCMTRSVLSGWKIGAYTALGSLTAITLIMTLSFTGLGIIVASSELVFTVIKWLGAGYLIYLGTRALLSKQTSYDIADINDTTDTANALAAPFFKPYINGFMVGAGNPKAIIFFTALFPQFINPNIAMLQQYIIFAGTFVVLELSWLLAYAYMGAKSANWIRQPGRATVFNRLTGSVFIGAGLYLATSEKG